MTLKQLRQKFRQGNTSFGSWLQIANLHSADLLQRPGFDWCVVDLEHGCLEENDFYSLVYAIEKHGKTPLVRLSDRNPAKIARLLENGAKGLILSTVEDVSTLEEVAAAIQFPPYGSRGVGYCKENGYGRDMNSYIKDDERPLIIAMIETVKGIDNIDEVAGYKYLDGLMVGPYDLSASLGCPGDFSNKKFSNSVKKVLSAANINNKFCGIHVLKDISREIKLRIRQGYKFLPVSTDANILVEGIAGIEKVIDSHL
jgi:2-dehydro-3-deoxyglucarate aldolase